MKQVIRFLVFAGLSTILCFTLYLVAQQHYRQDANDPQIQIAEDISRSLSEGKTVTLPQPVDLKNSLAPFIIVVDNNEKVVSASGSLNGQVVLPPTGSLTYASRTGENRITWEPAEDVRLATVIKPFTGKQSGYVIAGRSLREIELRENMLLFDVAMGWIVTLGISVIFAFL